MTAFWLQIDFVWHQNCASSCTSTTSKSFVCNKMLSSFRQKSIFLISALSSPCQVHSHLLSPAIPCFAAPPFGAFRSHLSITSIGYRMSDGLSRKKWRGEKGGLSFSVSESSPAAARYYWESVVRGRLGEQPPVPVPPVLAVYGVALTFRSASSVPLTPQRGVSVFRGAVL